MALVFIGALLFFFLNFLCCMEPAAEVLLGLIKSAVIKRSLLISLEHPGQPSLWLQEWRVELVTKDQICPWEAGSVGGFEQSLLGGFGRAVLSV